MASVILQARMGSTRLPAKAMMPILGKPMLWYTIETLKRSPAVDRIVLAIPQNVIDNPLAELAESCGIDCFRGDEADVLKRTYNASLIYKDNYYFRATGDNPIIDYENPGRTLEYLISRRLDYVQETGMPIGAVVEAFTFDALQRAFEKGTRPRDREHVTWYIKKSGHFKAEYIKAPAELICPQLRLTVDYPEDFKRVGFIIEHLYKDGIPEFKDVIKFAREEKVGERGDSVFENLKS